MPKPKRLDTELDKLTIRNYLAASRRYPKDFYLSWLPLVSAVCISTLMPYFLGKILAALARPGTELKSAVIGFIIVGLLGIIINRIAFMSLLRLQAVVMADLQRDAINSLAYRGTSFHNNQVGGKLVSDALDYPQAYLRLSDTIIVNMLPFFAVLTVGVTILLIQAPLIGLTVLLMAAFAIGSAIQFRMKMAKYRHERIQATKAVTAHTADVIGNIQTVKSFAREREEIRASNGLISKLEGLRIRDWAKLATNGNNRITALFFFESLLLLVMIYQITHHPELLAAGIFALTYIVTLTSRMFEIGNMMRGIEEALLLAEPMTAIMRQEPEVKDVKNASALKVEKGAVKLDNVKFVYDDNPGGENVFAGLNIDIKPGERIGLVGPSGGGKTTLTKLLLRFEDITGGRIEIDGQDISQVTQRSLRQSIGYVSQEPLLFHRSIKDNIAYGNVDASEEQIISAATKAFAHEFITQLPKAYETIVGERGVKLSGGQRQRIAIARAILKDAPVLVLDEATSALDSESEVLIQKALWQLMEGRTAIVIAHRLSTIQKMDRIMVMDNGAIVEQGSHKELLVENKLYAKLWAHQSGGFLED